jgi:hypothetical protein
MLASCSIVATKRSRFGRAATLLGSIPVADLVGEAEMSVGNAVTFVSNGGQCSPENLRNLVASATI